MSTMLCPVCPQHPELRDGVGGSGFRCPCCNEILLVINDPVSPTRSYPAIQVLSGQRDDVPRDALLGPIVDQSPEETPRYMIIEFDKGSAVVIAYALSQPSRYTPEMRAGLRKTSGAIKREALVVQLPDDLMLHLRSVARRCEQG